LFERIYCELFCAVCRWYFEFMPQEENRFTLPHFEVKTQALKVSIMATLSIKRS
jgi:hypothetical protein